MVLARKHLVQVLQRDLIWVGACPYLRKGHGHGTGEVMEQVEHEVEMELQLGVEVQGQRGMGRDKAYCCLAGQK